MTVAGWVEILLFAGALTALTPVVGAYLARVFRGELRGSAGSSAASTRSSASSPARGQDWKGYARSVLVVSVVFGVLPLRADPRSQGVLPGNPQDLGGPSWDLSFNTTASFLTNTNWQYYAGETTMSYLTQMAGLAVQNFVSAGVGHRGARRLRPRPRLPLGQGARQLLRRPHAGDPLRPAAAVDRGRARARLPGRHPDAPGLRAPSTTVTGGEQDFAYGPVAGQEAIKLLGTNGGGFFNVNSAMPYENPTWLSNFVEMLAILLIPAGLTSMYGRMVGNKRQGWMVFGAMMTLFVVAVAVIYVNESDPTPAMQAAGLTGPNLEGKEQRFGIGSTALFAAVTTAASCGAVNAAMESLSGFGGAIPMAQMMTGEVIWGGVGSGLYSMLLFVILGVFISGLMVGRTPEFLGKKIEAREVKLTIIGTIAVPMMVLVGDRARHRHEVRRRRRSTTAARRASPRRSTPTRRRATTTARRSPATPATCSPRHERGAFRHHVRRRARRPRDARRPLPAAARRARHRRLARRQAGQPRRPRARCGRTPRPSASSSSRSS